MDYTPKFRVWPNDIIPRFAGIWPTAVSLKDCRRPTRVTEQDYYCIHIVLRGRLKYIVENKADTVLTADDMFVTWPGDRFYYISPDQSEETCARIYWVRLVGCLVREYFQAMGFSDECFIKKALKPDIVKALFEELFAVAENYDDNADINTVLTLYRMISAVQYVKAENRQKASLAVKVKEFMENEADKGLNIEQICTAFSISRSSLFLSFKREFGKSPMEYLEEIRIMKAKQLLENTEMSVRKIAIAAGYSGDMHFIRHFKKMTGITPGEYKKVF